jgi:hypothetical protein
MSNLSSSPRSQYSSSPFKDNGLFYQDEDHSGIHNLFVGVDTVKQQRINAYEMVDLEAEAAKERTKAEYESNKIAIEMRANHELEIAQVNLEQSRQQALFALDQQHAQRRLEIEQRAQEQRLSIETAARQLLLQAQEQRLNKELHQKLASIPRSGSTVFNFKHSHQSI